MSKCIKFKLVKDKKYKLHNSGEFKIIKYNDDEFNNQIEIKLKEFINVMLNNFDKANLGLFSHKLDGLSVKKYNFRNFELIDGRTASYNTIKNTITIKEDKINDIYHELFHMASSIYSKKQKVIFSGFSQRNLLRNFNSGISLNEGYTELLTERYFPSKQKSTYTVEKSFAKAIESVIGQEKMETLYLKADLPGLVKELQKFCTDTEIGVLFYNMDIISECCHNRIFKENDEINKIVNSFRKVVPILVKCHCYKYIETNDNLELDDVYKQINLFFGSGLGTHFMVNNEMITIFTQTELFNLFNYYLIVQKKQNLNIK